MATISKFDYGLTAFDKLDAKIANDMKNALIESYKKQDLIQGRVPMCCDPRTYTMCSPKGKMYLICSDVSRVMEDRSYLKKLGWTE